MPDGGSNAAGDDTHPCVDCGDPYFQRIGGYWKVDDGLWDEVVGDNTITLCPACFAARANSRDIYLRWMAYRDTTTEEVTMNAATAAPYYAPSRAEATAEIIRRAEWLQSEADSYERRLENATQAGADLAATVSLFLEDPQALGTDALYEANQHFLSLHAGNFTHGDPGPSSSGPMCSL